MQTKRLEILIGQVPIVGWFFFK